MDYEKKYNEALEKARRLYEGKDKAPEEPILEYLFSELKPDDETTRNEILVYIGSKTDIDLETHNRWCSYLEKQKEHKPAEKQDYSGLNDLERAILRGFLCAGVKNVPVGIIKDTAYECMGFLALIEPNPAEWSEEDEKMRTNAVLSLQYLIEEFPNADFIDSVKKEKAWLESFRPQPQGVYKQIVHSIYKMLKGKDFYGMSTSNCISLLNDIRVKCKDADECAKILDEPSRKSIEELLDALDVTLGNFINKLNAL